MAAALEGRMRMRSSSQSGFRFGGSKRMRVGGHWAGGRSNEATGEVRLDPFKNVELQRARLAHP